MTVEEKRKELEKYCDTKNCSGCPLEFMSEKDGVCYTGLGAEEIERNYKIIFGKETEEQNVKTERKTTLRDLLDYVEVPIVVSEEDFRSPIITLNNLDECSLEEYESILTPEFLDREIYRIKSKDNIILVALEVVE